MAHPLPPTPTATPTPRPSKRTPVPLILSSFPAPPSHIPPTPSSAGSNPPPTGPPTAPLPPLPSGPSRISEHEQLLLLSSVRSRRSSKYSQRDSIHSNGSPNRDSMLSMRSPSSLGRPSLSVSRSNSMTLSPTPPTSTSPFQQLTKMSMSPIPLSDISDSDSDAAKTIPSPALSPVSPRLGRRHQLNESISSIDMRNVLGVYADDLDDIHTDRRPRLQSIARQARHLHKKSIADPIDPGMLLSTLEAEDTPPPATTTAASPLPLSPSDSYRHARSTSTVTAGAQSHTPHTRSISNSSTSVGRGGLGSSLPSAPQPLSPSSRSSSSSTSTSTSPSISTSTTSANLEPTITDSSSTTTQFSTISSSDSIPSIATAIIQDFQRSRSREYVGKREEGVSEGREETADLDSRSQPSLSLAGTLVTKTTTATPRGNDEMTLDELGPQRVPSPDIATILSATPRPALSRSGADTETRSKSRSKSRVPARKRRACTTDAGVYPEGNACPQPINRNRRQSEGAPTNAPTVSKHGKYPSSDLAYLHKHRDSISSTGTNGLSPSTNYKKLPLSRSMSAATPGYYDPEAEDGYYDEALERVLEGNGSEDEEDTAVWDGGADGDKQRGRRSRRVGGKEGEGDSDSSLDLHTPLPHLMLRHGLLSPNSKLLPQAECSRAGTPADGRPGSIMSVLSTGSVMTKSGIIKDERDTVTRRVRHRDGKLLRGGIGLTTGLGWSDSEDEDAPSPLTRRLSSLNLSKRTSASSVRSANLPPLSASISSSSLRRLHPLSRSYSSGAIQEMEGSYDPYSYTYDDEEEDDEEEDHTLEESGQWAQRHRLGVSPTKTSPPVSWQRRQPPSRNRRNHQTSALGARTSTSSVGSTFSLEVTIPEGGEEKERSKTPSRLRRPGSHTSIKSTTVGAGGGRDSSGSSSLDNRSSGLSSNFSLNHQRRSAGDDNNNNNGNTPSSTASTLSIPMPSTPKDIFDPGAPPLLSSTRGMLLVNKEKSLPPLPTGGLKKKASGLVQKSSSSTIGSGKYAFPSSTRVRTLSAASSVSNSTPPPPPTVVDPSSSLISSSSSAATLKAHVRPLQLPRQTTSPRGVGDRPAVPVPSPILNSPPPPATQSLRGSTYSLSGSTRRSPLTPILSSHGGGVASAPTSPATINRDFGVGGSPNHHSNSASASDIVTTITHTTTGIVRPKPRTGTGMAYRTSSYALGSKMRAPMMLSTTASPVVSGGAAGSGGSSSTGGGGGSIGASNGVPRAIAL